MEKKGKRGKLVKRGPAESLGKKGIEGKGEKLGSKGKRASKETWG